MKAKKEVVHFTAERTEDYAYGCIWHQVVNEYLRTGYKEEGSNPDVVVMGETYRTLKRPKVTVFYDAAGDTLFDVTNERLEKEYEWLMNSDVGDEAENADTRGEIDAEDDVIPMGTASLREIVAGLPAPTAEEIAVAKEESAKPVKQRAKEKLKREMEAAKDRAFAEPVIGYLLGRCKEDQGLAEDVVQEHKTWQKCFDYIYSQARKQVKGNCAAVRDEVVYEWAEDYYHKDDRAEEEKKAKEAAERKIKEEARRKEAAGQKKGDRKGTEPAEKKADKAGRKPAEPPKPKKPKEMDGQMDLFSMMGM
ncbi:PcfK-like family protein [Acetatifactor aquisgranensis]|uniref:PcfK-like family protein n=1 Tax=Acetatifactor aquisgranensis TaxID=2941233 RepID=UPI002041D8AD|nr:PcfK-like family protein [Acetatifactor aquisgranensis]